MVKLSIIVPYYETYDLTMKLLRSLAVQKTDEVEIILIDDYCKDEFSKLKTEKDEVLLKGEIILSNHKENKGVAKSRNEGIIIAKGKYVAFIDCDDMVTSDYIEVLLKAIDLYDTDVINFNWVDLTTNQLYRKPKNYAPWKAIYKKETMPLFREDMEYGSEDIDFQIEITGGKYTITYLDRLLYMYNSNRVGSLMWKKTHKEEI